MRYIPLILACVVLVAGCAMPASRSAYPSGWSMDRSAQVQKQCGVVWIGMVHSTPSNVPYLVSKGLLNQEQATRVDMQDVRPGDPECMVYAAYGLREGQATFQWDAKKRLVSIQFDYRCDVSPLACPGRRVLVSDGRVSAISRL